MSLIEPITFYETPAPVPGLYPGIDFDTYAAWDAASQTILNRFHRTPAHVLHELKMGGKTTPALELGWLTHLATFEPERYAAEILAAPNVDGRTKDGKRAWAKLRVEAELRDKRPVSYKDDCRARAMAAAVHDHETARLFLRSQGKNEISIVWDEQVGNYLIRCKARLDRYGYLNEWPILGDLKTSRNAARPEFEKSILNFGYDVQAAHYLSGLETLYPIEQGDPFRRFIFIVIESEPPHCCALYELDDDSLEEGERKRQVYLRKWRECVESSSWPGYPAGIQTASLPPWALKNWIDE